MFEQTLVQTQAQTRRPWTVAVSLSLQCGVVATLLLLPLLRPETLRMPEPPKAHLIRAWITQPPLPPQKAISRTATIAAPAAPRPLVYVPTNLRTTAARRVDVPSAEAELTGWAGPPTTAFGAPLTDTTVLPPRAVAQSPAVATPSKTVAAGPLKVGGDVESARLLFGPHPSYPTIAIAARSQGVVRLEAVIAANGSIRNLRVVSGPPLLVAAALDAVRQWRYQPTLLNGVAVEVLTEIEVNFSLAK
jgi:protein TonB